MYPDADPSKRYGIRRLRPYFLRPAGDRFLHLQRPGPVDPRQRRRRFRFLGEAARRVEQSATPDDSGRLVMRWTVDVDISFEVREDVHD